jgi:hypothetical protein
MPERFIMNEWILNTHALAQKLGKVDEVENIMRKYMSENWTESLQEKIKNEIWEVLNV